MNGQPPRQSTFPPSPASGPYNPHTPPPRAYTDLHAPPPTPPRPSPVPYNHPHRPSFGAPPAPPQVPQAFGHGAPDSYRFQYSNCSGRRKALLVGINYFGQANQLRGCINDVTQMSTFLNQVYGYRREDMVILTDDQQNPMSQPTKANIIRAMHWLVKDAMPNDSLFIHFSGHGGRTPDLDGDEDDGWYRIKLYITRNQTKIWIGFDDVIYPVDYKVAGHIVDDDMHDIMVKPLRPGVRLTAIFDSCHSGTALDLPFIYSTQGVLKEPNLAKEAAQDLFSAFSSYEKGDLGSVATTAISFFKKATIGGSARERSLMTKTSPADVVMFSGSKDTQTSADTFQGGQARGALSWAFIESLKRYPKQSYLQLLNTIRAKLEKSYSQKPQLSCSHPLDVNLLFVL
ncbi:caspase domain-containing protein [Talaromyces proteolyticus]|uniref:Metacaspase-1B n=1 Tax=Talaromyces proteolyticus TaxID=1131652 RepID=A0AAD4KKM0_9EURO|nr:caspase domain-containing protein [Talaromyces proteolyticus]KAH8694968.1 caspase domain-containing protein [Talaromyces proteolyticus]